ncbi:hypothetical protein Bbelb_196040 [Branchiostoma belcheri]|nr:hypothetical protein Bbelb_196040 [Branchiostoma belcheri]
MRNVHRHAECPQACGMSTGISLTHIYAHIPGTLKTCLPHMVLLSVTPGLVHYALRGGVTCLYGITQTAISQIMSEVNDLLADAPLPAYLGRMPTWSRQRR